MSDATKLRPEDLTSEERAFNKLTPTQTELLALLSEECGEVVQVIGKILRHGLESCHPNGGPTNRELLAEEIGDCLCASRLLASAGMLNMASVEDRSAAKMEKVFRYLHHARRALFASAPEKAAKVETMADRIAAETASVARLDPRLLSTGRACTWAAFQQQMKPASRRRASSNRPTKARARGEGDGQSVDLQEVRGSDARA